MYDKIYLKQTKITRLKTPQHKGPDAAQTERGLKANTSNTNLFFRVHVFVKSLEGVNVEFHEFT